MVSGMATAARVTPAMMSGTSQERWYPRSPLGSRFMSSSDRPRRAARTRAIRAKPAIGRRRDGRQTRRERAARPRIHPDRVARPSRTSGSAGRSRRPGARTASSASSRRVSRWSNQWAVASCSARNRVIGGSSGRPVHAHSRSATAPAATASGNGHRPRPGVDPGGRADPLDQLQDGPRLAVGHHAARGRARTSAAVQRGHQGVDGVVDVRRVDEGVTAGDDREAAGPRRAPRSAPRAGCPRVPTPGAGRTATTAKPGASAASASISAAALVRE